jgi:hypothetical protein
MIPGKKDKVSRLLYKLYEFDVSILIIITTSSTATSLSDDDLVTISQLKAILQETFLKPAVATP